MASRYKILEELGSGGSGAVFKAYDTQLDRYVAIKRLLNKEQSDQQDSQSGGIKKEAASLATLQHPNVVSVFDLGSDEDGFFMVMELVEGETLADWISVTPMTIADFNELATQMLEALISAHSHSILHRDLKPENIKIRRLPTGRLQVKVLDFGLARLSHSARSMTEDQSGNIVGSVYYMSPEQFLRKPIDGRTDLYSLGCILYQALSTYRPFAGETVQEIMDAHLNHQVYPLKEVAEQVPGPVCDWVMWLFNVDVADRPPNAQQALATLRGLAMAGWMSERAVEAEPVAVAIAVPDVSYTPAPVGRISTGNVPRPGGAGSQRLAGTGSQRLSAGVPAGPRGSGPVPPLGGGLGRPPRRDPQEEADEAASKKKIWILSSVAVVLFGVAAYFLFIRPTPVKPGQRVYTSTSDVPPPADVLTAAPERTPDFIEPGIILHYRGGERMDAVAQTQPPAASKAGEAVYAWHDLAGAAGDGILQGYSRQPLLCPTYVNERPEGLRYPAGFLRFTTGQGLIHTQRADSVDAKFYPLGGAPLDPGRDPGLTVVMVVRPNMTGSDKETRIIRMRNQDDKGYINVRAYANNDWKIGIRVGAIVKEAKVTGRNAKLFSVVGFTWNTKTSKMVLAVRTEDGTKARVEADTPKEAPGVINEIRIADLDGSAPPEEKFAGDIAEIMVWSYAMGWEERSGQEYRLVKDYFRTPGTRY